MSIDVITLFPEWFDWMRRPRHLNNAAAQSGLEIRCFNPREHTPLGQGQVDDSPYGGGPGMVLRVDVMAAAFEAIYGMPAEQVRDHRRVVVLTPRGRPFTDAVARELAEVPDLTLLAGRYEGFDERIHTHLANDAISLGPFVLAGGEVADAATALGREACAWLRLRLGARHTHSRGGSVPTHCGHGHAHTARRVCSARARRGAEGPASSGVGLTEPRE